MAKVLKLLRGIVNLLIFVMAISQIFLYEACINSLEKILKVELLWKFLVNFGV